MSTSGPADRDDDAAAQHPSEGGSTAASAGPRGRRGDDKKKGSLWRELPVLLVIAFVLALLVKTFLVQAFFIPSGSMEQTLHGCTGCTGDRVLVNKVPYWFGDPSPGDIVVFKGPDNWTPEVSVAEPSNWAAKGLRAIGRAVGVAPPSEDDYVKRVIATGGQTVQCCDDQGRVTVDGKPLTEPYIYQDSPLGEGPSCTVRQFGPVTVPKGRLWVMGDHRSQSADSRCHMDKYSGTIGVDDVIGKAQLIVWPLNRFTWLKSPDIQSSDAQGAAAPGSAAVPALSGAAAVAAPYALGLAGAVPVTAGRRRLRRRLRRRGSRAARMTGPSRRPPRTGWRRMRRAPSTRPTRETGAD